MKNIKVNDIIAIQIISFCILSMYVVHKIEYKQYESSNCNIYCFITKNKCKKLHLVYYKTKLYYILNA